MSAPLRIALVGPCRADLRSDCGGPDAVVALLARGLAGRGERVEVLSCDFETKTDRLLEVEGVRLHRLAARKTLGRATFYLLERRWIRRRLRELAPDVVHVHGTDFYGGVAARHAGPTLLTVNALLARASDDLNGTPPLRRLPRTIRSLAMAGFEDRCLARAREVVVPNRHLRAALEGRTRARLHEIPEPIDPAYFDLPDRTVPDRLLYVGAIGPRKGLLDLAHALPEVARVRPGVRLHVVGETADPGYAAAVSEAVQREGLGEAVVWRGPLDPRRLQEAFASCSILVLPSAEELVPHVAAQAMAAGKPVVAHAVGAVPHVVVDGETGLLVPRGNPIAMADALLALLEDEPRRRAIGSRSTAVARERFDPQVVVDRTVRLYREVAGRDGSARRATPARVWLSERIERMGGAQPVVARRAVGGTTFALPA
ncbi:MAG TPA: glycosyltransferase family 4 protein [Planctomycetota bacterium]|nr:glycosyltransferase family 4 protein [Planctomycetota bacterium]